MSDCPHDLIEREIACFDGMCPLCQQAEIERLRAALQPLIRFIEGNTWPHYAREHLEQARRSLGEKI
jgi:hypothetical protein